MTAGLLRLAEVASGSKMVLAGKDTIPCARGEIDILSKRHEFLFLCAHGTKHGWETIRWIIDLARLGRTLTSEDARAITQLAERLHARRLLTLGLTVVADILGLRIVVFDRSLFEGDEKMRGMVGTVRNRIALSLGMMTAAPKAFICTGPARRIHPGLKVEGHRVGEIERDEILVPAACWTGHPANVRRVVFVNYAAGAEVELKPMSPAAGAFELLRCAFNLVDHKQASVARAADLAGGIEFHNLTYSKADRAVDMLDELR